MEIDSSLSLYICSIGDKSETHFLVSHEKPIFRPLCSIAVCFSILNDIEAYQFSKNFRKIMLIINKNRKENNLKFLRKTEKIK
jgi:molybdopterin-guanine dinucleotide biosynthesis protein A